ncbi:MAG: hypothetical protein SF053_12845, partial [Bacteroidia bacterium]|nr:hypothetical protein [Bacteroidia bacterium]
MAHAKGLLYRCIWLGISMAVLATQARHLVGGDMTYRCLGVDAQGQSRYEITLKVYRDCREQSPGQPNTPFDREVSIAVFNNATLQQTLEFKTRLTDSTILSLRGSDPCVPPPPGLCYAEGVYRDTITLAPSVRGYTLEWGRCCRNETIRNIFQPGSAGVVFTASIPNTTLCNNSPAFKNALPTYICVNDLFTFDHSATDADGDSLVYRITTPFTAGSPLDPFPLPMPPPYPQVTWLGGYGTTNYMDGNPDITLDPISGNMEVRPTQLGQYVFSVSVYEYRNGTLLSEIKRDLQINVIECPINYPPQVSLPSGPDVRGDTLVFYQGELACFDLSILDINGPGVKVDSIQFSVTGEVFSAPYNASLTLTTDLLSPEIARICWNPGCNPLPIQYSQIYISMTDNNDCPGPNQAFDTLILQVLPPPTPTPELTCIRTTGAQVVELNWDLQVSPPGGFDAWIIYRDTGTGWSPLVTLSDPDQRQYTDSSAGAAPCYYIAMRTVCPVPVIGSPSDTICLSSKPEVNLCQVTQDPAAAAATISWTFNDVPDFSGYRVYRRLPGSQTFTLIAELTDPTLRSYTDVLPPGAGPVCYQLSVQDN